MDPEEVAAALAQQQPERGGQSSWHGRIARDAQGRRIMWQEPPNGRGGRFVQMGEATATSQAREQLQGMRDRSTVLGRLAPLSQQYIERGNNATTGGWFADSYAAMTNPETQHHLFRGWNFPTGALPQEYRANLQGMRGLENEAVRANIAPGTSGAANSVFEQQVIRDMFPNIQALGSENSQRAARVHVNRDIERARIAAAEQWLTQNPDLGGFEAAWAQEETRLRPQLEARYSLRFRTPNRGSSRTGSTIGAAAGRPRGAPTARRQAPAAQPAQQPAQRLRWNPETEQLEPVR